MYSQLLDRGIGSEGDRLLSDIFSGVNEGAEIVSDEMWEKMQLKKSETALLCIDLQKCYYTHPTTQHFPNLEKVRGKIHINPT